MSKHTQQERTQDKLWPVHDILAFLSDITITGNEWENWSMSVNGRQGLSQILSHCRDETLEAIEELDPLREPHHIPATQS